MLGLRDRSYDLTSVSKETLGPRMHPSLRYALAQEEVAANWKSRILQRFLLCPVPDPPSKHHYTTTAKHQSYGFCTESASFLRFSNKLYKKYQGDRQIAKTTTKKSSCFPMRPVVEVLMKQTTPRTPTNHSPTKVAVG